MYYSYGRQNRDETIRALLALGMNSASEVVISGGSAGALGVYLGIDQMEEIIRRANSSTIVRGFADGGFFPEFTSSEPAIESSKSIGRDDPIVDGHIDYARAMRNVFKMANIGGDDSQCIRAHKHKSSSSSSRSVGLTDPSDCIFAFHLAPHIRVPIFSLQVMIFSACFVSCIQVPHPSLQGMRGGR